MKLSRSSMRVETRTQIIENCAPLLSREGYLSVSIPELEKASGESKAVLYGYFSNKNILVMAVLDYNLTRRRNTINQLIDSTSSGKDKLMAHVLFYYPKTSLSLIGENCQLFNAAVEIANQQNEMQQKIAEAILLWQQDVAAIIRTITINADINAEAAAWQLIALLESAVIISRVTQNRALGMQLLDQAKNFVINL